MRRAAAVLLVGFGLGGGLTACGGGEPEPNDGSRNATQSQAERERPADKAAAAEASGSADSGREDGARSETDGGAYVPASKNGPAKNVPKPTMPAAMKQDTPEGAEAAVQYWWDAVYYLDETGDAELVRQASHDECKYCQRYSDAVEAWYEDEGGWRGGSKVSMGWSAPYEVDGGIQVLTKLDMSAATAWDSAGTMVDELGDQALVDDSWSFLVKYDKGDGYWKMYFVNREKNG